MAGIFGPGAGRAPVEAMVAHLRHRGPDAQWVCGGPEAGGVLGYDRLSIIDRSAAGDEPLVGPTGIRIAFNGELYNHVELRAELADRPFRTATDTEVLLAAFERWGPQGLHKALGMFAVLFWDERAGTLVAARDRFGVKPLYYHHRADGTLVVASEIGALFAGGVPAVVDEVTWSAYLARGATDEGVRTFWSGVQRLPAGHFLRWRDGRIAVEPWYDLAAAVGDGDDDRPVEAVAEEYEGLLRDSVRLRFRSDVPVGICVSGGVDSATLVALVGQVSEQALHAYTFVTDDDRYDEDPWVDQLLAGSPHHPRRALLRPLDVPELARSVQAAQDEPFGGIPTLAYARLFEQARADGTTVLLDGQGMDEQWAGYDYYGRVAERGPGDPTAEASPVVQGASDPVLRAACLLDGFRALATASASPTTARDPLRELQLRDLCRTKLPRALRFNDRVSMRSSTELREPFLDHRLVELALRQPADRKWRHGRSKWLLRRMAADLLPGGLAEAPKRPVQTPQREWLRGPLQGWAQAHLDRALAAVGGRWLDEAAVRADWAAFSAGRGDNSFFVWQWVSLGLAIEQRPAAFEALT